MTGTTDLDALKALALGNEPKDPETSAKVDPLDGYTAIDTDESQRTELSPTAAARATVKPKAKREKVMNHPAGFKQLSVKIDRPAYDRLKQAAHFNGLSHQDILYEAALLWLKKHGY